MWQLKKFRIENNLKQEDLAKLANIDRTSISRYESGRQMPSAENLQKLAKALKCTVDELLLAQQNQSPLAG